MVTSETDGQIKSIADVKPVVDADFHLTESQEDFLPYLSDPYHKRLFEREEFGKQFDEPAGDFKSFYPSPGVFAPYNTGLVETRSVSDREEIRDAKEMLHVDRPICTPTQNLYLPGVQNDDFAVALASAYNEWLLDNIVDADDDIYGAVLVAPQKPDKAAEQIDDHADEDGIVAVFVPSGGVHPPLGDRDYDPIYDAASDNGLPVSFHSASGVIMDSFPMQKQAYNRYLPQHATAHAMQFMVHMSTMITTGVPARYPDLDFIFQESGLGWIPYMMRRLDHEYKTEREDAPLLEKMPSEYIKDQFKFTTQPIEGDEDPQYVSQIARLFEAENTLMFASDFPHYDFDNSDQLLKLTRGEFSADEIRNMYSNTALDTYAF